jgi:hypothetical protein
MDLLMIFMRRFCVHKDKDLSKKLKKWSIEWGKILNKFEWRHTKKYEEKNWKKKMMEKQVNKGYYVDIEK